MKANVSRAYMKSTIHQDRNKIGFVIVSFTFDSWKYQSLGQALLHYQWSEVYYFILYCNILYYIILYYIISYYIILCYIILYITYLPPLDLFDL